MRKNFASHVVHGWFKQQQRRSRQQRSNHRFSSPGRRSRQYLCVFSVVKKGPSTFRCHTCHAAVIRFCLSRVGTALDGSVAIRSVSRHPAQHRSRSSYSQQRTAPMCSSTRKQLFAASHLCLFGVVAARSAVRSGARERRVGLRHRGEPHGGVAAVPIRGGDTKSSFNRAHVSSYKPKHVCMYRTIRTQCGFDQLRISCCPCVPCVTFCVSFFS